MATNMRRRQFDLLVLFLLAFLHPVTAATNQTISSLVSQVPSCAMPCLLTGLENGGCKLTSVPVLTDCLCTNITLQAELSACVQKKCFFTDQTRSATLQRDICEAYPKESRAREARVIAICLSVITFPVVALRCISRWMVTQRLWWDDWMVVFSTVLLATMAGVQIAGTDIGFGLHYWNVDPRQSVRLIQLFYAGQQLYILVQVFAKISILLFFSRVFASARWFQVAIRWFIGVLVVHGVVYLFLVVFECTPVSSTWDLGDPNRSCSNLAAIAYSGALFSIVEDLAILALPIPEIIQLELSVRKRFALALLFSLGIFACATSMIRLKFVIMFSASLDVTWDNVDIVIWSLIELFCAILCASLPALRPLLRSLGAKFGLTSRGSAAVPLRKSMMNYGNDRFREISDFTPSTDITMSPVGPKSGDSQVKYSPYVNRVSCFDHS